jgi:hypothetical protein
MRAAVALLVSMTLSTAACFPHNEQHRTYAKIGEGGALAAGILISALSNTGADCDEQRAPGTELTDCRSNAHALGTVGVVLILAGLLGFVATVSTAEDEDKSSAKVQQVPTVVVPTPAVAAPTPPVTTTPSATTTNTQATGPQPVPATDGAGSGSDAGSAAPVTP